MYQALYRKYRPTTFDDVVGQTVIIKTLKNAIIHQKLTHAYLFTGPRGTGKTSIAKILAKTINCTNLDNTTPCDICVSCTQINDKQTTDIIEIDAASNNGVDEIRELKSKVNLVPATSKYKVYIIDEVHMLTVGAFNALLKTLEEPPAHIVFILATTEPHKIPLTILSRCQRFDFQKISEIDIVKRLNYVVEKENIKIDETALYEIARLSDGGMRDSLSMLDQLISYTDDVITEKDVHEVNGTVTQEELKEFVNYLLQKELSQLFTVLDEYNRQGKDFVKLTEELILFLRNTILSVTVPSYFQTLKMNGTIYESISNIVSISQILEMIDILNQTIIEMKNSNQPKMILELNMIKLMNLSEPKKASVESKTTVTTEKVTIPEVKPEKKKVTIPEKKVIAIPEAPKPVERAEISPEIKAKLDQIKSLRISNTLSEFNKKTLLSIKNNIDEVRDFILNPDFSQFASLVLDGELKAASERNLIFVFETAELANFFNESLINIEKMIDLAFQTHYAIIGTDNEEWEKIKTEFNQKTKVYQYQEEPFDLIEVLKPKEKEKDDIQQLFGDIVEYQ